ncbi:MAG: cereblon family protein [Desulfobacter sp.]
MCVDLVCKKISGETDARSDPETMAQEDPVIICRNCHLHITWPEFQIEVNQGFSHTFANPQGHVFEIGCFSTAAGCVKASAPSSEFSWFNGYVWSVGICRGCQTQLGWIFSSTEGKTPARFFGLILETLIFP